MSDPKVRIESVVMVPIRSIKRHPDNPNKHSPDQVERIARIIEYQGWRRPLTISNLSGYLTVGHGRLDAAVLRGWKKVPVMRQDYESRAQEYADIVADNTIANWADLDLSMVNANIPGLGTDFDIDLLGLKSFGIDITELPDLPDGDRNPLRQVAFQVTEQQEKQLLRALKIAKDMGPFGDTGNSNSNGNAITRITKTFLDEITKWA